MSSESWEEPDGTVADGGMIDQPDADSAEGPAAIISRLGDELMAIPGVEGVGLTAAPDGSDAIIAYLRDASVAAQIPSILGGLPTVVEVTGQIDALPEP